MMAYRFARCLFLFAAVLVAAATSAQASVEISADPTKNMNCSGGVCTPTAKKAVLNATDLANMLATSDVKVVTGSGAVTITVSQSFSWTSTHRLTLDANLNVSFRAPVVVAGQGAVTIVTNDGGTGGDLLFFPGGKLDFWDTSSSLVISGNSYELASGLGPLQRAANANPQGRFALIRDNNAATKSPRRKSPIYSLQGEIEGLGHTISNISISEKGKHAYAGGLVTYNAGTIRDLRLRNLSVQVSGTDNLAGGLAAANGGIITNVDTAGQVLGAPTAVYHAAVLGGIAGANSGTLTASGSAVSVTGMPGEEGYATGGLVGNNGGRIERSHASGSITGADGSVQGHNGEAGALVGFNSVLAIIDQSYAGGIVGGPVSLVGGLVGWNEANIFNSYANGSAIGIVAGGLVGDTEDDRIESSYSTTAVTGTAESGGFVGFEGDQPTNNDCYWDLDTSGISDPSQGAGNVPNDPGITGLTDAQLKSGLPSGFDPAIWAIRKNINNGYPYLLANPPQ